MPRPAQPVAPPPAGFVARPARPSDAAAVARVIAADEERHRGRATTTAEQVTADWAGADLEQDSVVVEDAQGRVVAVGDAVPNRAELLLAYGYVDPTRSGEGLGAYLVGFFEARARRLAAGAGAPAPDAPPVRVRHYLPEANAGARRLLEGRGYAFVRAVLGMERELEGPLPAPAWPAGVSVRDYRGGADEPAVYEAFELGSSGMWGRPGNDFEQWAPRAASYDPTLFQLAEADGAIVGLSIAAAPTGDDPDRRGHVLSLRVVPAWCRRGLGAALLEKALADLRARGARSAWLSVDAESPSGAPRLYLAAGMRVTQRYLVFEKAVG